MIIPTFNNHAPNSKFENLFGHFLKYLSSYCLFIGYCLLVIYLNAPGIIKAESLSVSLQVGTTQVTFSGYTSPSAFVVIKEGIDVIGTSTSDSNGDWSTTINVTTPNIHTYTLYSTDSQSRQSSSVEYTLNVIGNTTTSITNVVIPPTTSLSGTIISGATHPSATITLTVSNGDTATITPDSAGLWNYDLATLIPGTYTISATATIPPSFLSLASTLLTLNISAPSPSPSSVTSASSAPSTSTQPSTPAQQPTPSPSPSPINRPFFIAIYDTNNDGVLNKTELIDIIKSWLRKLLICDLNHDTKCNLIDLSILLYYIDR